MSKSNERPATMPGPWQIERKRTARSGVLVLIVDRDGFEVARMAGETVTEMETLARFIIDACAAFSPSEASQP